MTTDNRISRKQENNKREPDKLDRALMAGYSFTLSTTPTHELVMVRIVKPNGEVFTDVFNRLKEDGALDGLDRAAHIVEQLRILDAERNRRRRSPSKMDDADA